MPIPSSGATEVQNSIPSPFEETTSSVQNLTKAQKPTLATDTFSVSVQNALFSNPPPEWNGSHPLHLPSFQEGVRGILRGNAIQQAQQILRGSELYQTGNYEGAMERYSEVIAQRPSDKLLRLLRSEATKAYLSSLNVSELTEEQKEPIRQLFAQIHQDQVMAVALDAEQQHAELAALRSSILEIQTESPETQTQLFELLNRQAEVLLGLAHTTYPNSQDSEFVQEKLQGLASEVYGLLASFCAGSSVTTLQKKAELYKGYHRLALGDEEGGRVHLAAIANEVPEAKERLDYLDRAKLRKLNLGTLQTWKAFVEEGDAVKTERGKTVAGQFATVFDHWLRDDGLWSDDERAIRYAEEKQLIQLVEEKLQSGKVDSVLAGLKLIVNERQAPAEVRVRAYGLIQDSEDLTLVDGHSNLIERLIYYTSRLDAKAQYGNHYDLESLLYSKAQGLEDEGLFYGVGQAALGVFSVLASHTNNPSLQKKLEEKLNPDDKGIGDYMWAFLRQTNPEALAMEVSVMTVSLGLGMMVKLRQLDRVRGATQMGLKTWARVNVPMLLTSGTALWGFHTAQAGLTQDPEKVLSPAQLAKTWGASVIMLGSVMGSATLGGMAGTSLARYLGLVAQGGAELSKLGKVLLWSGGHTFGMTGMAISTQVNQAAKLQETPPGGIEESLAYDVVGYIRFALANKLLNRLSGGKLVKFSQQWHREIALKQAQLKVEGELARLGHPILARDGKGEPILPRFSNPNSQQVYEQLVTASLTRPGFSVREFANRMQQGKSEAGDYAKQFNLRLDFQRGKLSSLRPPTLHEQLQEALYGKTLGIKAKDAELLEALFGPEILKDLRFQEQEVGVDPHGRRIPIPEVSEANPPLLEGLSLRVVERPAMGVLGKKAPLTAEVESRRAVSQRLATRLQVDGKVAPELVQDTNQVKELLRDFGVTTHKLDIEAFRQGYEFARKFPERARETAWDVDEVVLHWTISLSDALKSKLFNALTLKWFGKDREATFYHTDPSVLNYQPFPDQLPLYKRFKFYLFEKILPERMRQHVQFHPGVRAFYLGQRLALGENLTMVSTGPAGRILMFANEDPVFKMVYFGKQPHEAVTITEVRDNPNLYTRETLVQAMRKVLAGQVDLAHPLIQDYVRRVQANPKKGAKFKHPALALILEKTPFVNLVDDSGLTFEMLGKMEGFTILKVPSARPKYLRNFLLPFSSSTHYLNCMSNGYVGDLVSVLSNPKALRSQTLPSNTETPADYPHQRFFIEIPFGRYSKEFWRPGSELKYLGKQFKTISLPEPAQDSNNPSLGAP